jgi:hypothetical protein
VHCIVIQIGFYAIGIGFSGEAGRCQADDDYDDDLKRMRILRLEKRYKH